MRTWGEGVKKPENFADVIYGRPLMCLRAEANAVFNAFNAVTETYPGPERRLKPIGIGSCDMPEAADRDGV